MDTPKLISGIQRILGMVTYMGKFIPKLSQITLSLCSLAKSTPFKAGTQLLDVFHACAIALVIQCLAFFRPAPHLASPWVGASTLY